MRAKTLGLITVSAVLCTVLISAPAHAKLISLEIQITSPDRTVRVSPTEFVESVNDGVNLPFGFKEIAAPANPPNDAPLTVRYFIFINPSEQGRVFSELEPGVVRKTYLVLSYHRTPLGAVGQILPGGDDRLFQEGQWVRFSSGFVGMVEQALKEYPSVTPVNPPPHQWQPHPASLEAVTARAARLRFVAFLLGGALFLLLAVLMATLLIWSQRVVRRKELELSDAASRAV
jgi:hypothetical protein